MKLVHPEQLAKAQLLLLPVAAFAAIMAFVSARMTWDIEWFFKPWMNAVRAGGLGSLSGEFSNYTPPNIYVLYLASWLVPLIGMVATIKLVSLPFVLMISLGLYRVVLCASADRGRAFAAACGIWVLPTLFTNAFVWGMSDSIYSAFLLWFVAFAMAGRPAAAAIAFGLALSFKAQALLLAPIFLYLLLVRRMTLLHLPLVPAVYVAMMIPAVLAGRPWIECLTVYFTQAGTYQYLRVTAPNLWQVAAYFFSYKTGLAIGLAAAVAAGAALSLFAARLRRDATTLVLVAATTATLMPFLTPKMHERYFFPAELLVFALAFVLPRYWSAAVLIQVGTMLAYMKYMVRLDRADQWAVIPVSLGLGVLLLALLLAWREAQDVPPAVTPAPAAPTLR
jgi:Gpi18-like mannosyltransferase